MKSTASATIAPERAKRSKLSRAEAEALLEATFGAAPRDPRDFRVELALMARQRKLLQAVLTPRSRRLGPGQVEALMDALEDFGDCDVAAITGIDWFAEDVKVPAMDSVRMRALITRAAQAGGLTVERLLERVEAGMDSEEARLRAALAGLARRPTRDLRAAGPGR